MGVLCYEYAAEDDEYDIGKSGEQYVTVKRYLSIIAAEAEI
jgi:hypothetical protein